MSIEFNGAEHYNPSRGLTRGNIEFIEFWMQNSFGSLFEQVNSYLLLFIIHSFLHFLFYFHVAPNSNCSNSRLPRSIWKYSKAKILRHGLSLSISKRCFGERGLQIPCYSSRTGCNGLWLDGRPHPGRFCLGLTPLIRATTFVKLSGYFFIVYIPCTYFFIVYFVFFQILKLTVFHSL